MQLLVCHIDNVILPFNPKKKKTITKAKDAETQKVDINVKTFN